MGKQKCCLQGTRRSSKFQARGSGANKPDWSSSGVATCGLSPVCSLLSFNPRNSNPRGHTGGRSFVFMSRIYWRLARGFFAFFWNFLSYFSVFFPFFLLSSFLCFSRECRRKVEKFQIHILVITCVVLACQLSQMAQNGLFEPIWAKYGQYGESSTLWERVQLSQREFNSLRHKPTFTWTCWVREFMSLWVGSCLWEWVHVSETWTHSQRHELTLRDMNSLSETWIHF